jgi:hypothetical protein
MLALISQLLLWSQEILASRHLVDLIVNAERSMDKLFALACLTSKAAHQAAGLSA